MAWEIKDEWIDLALGRHSVVFHNGDVLVPHAVTGTMVPVEHHLHHEFKLEGCPHCGHVKESKVGEHVDFHAVKTGVHESLKAHHKQMMQYREKHKHVRLGHGPKG